MKKVYICSPYRATDSAELDRHIDYAQQLTRQALEAGLAPIAPHLYMTQCLDEDKPEQRATGMAAGLELLKICDFVIAGTKYGISEGMEREMQQAAALGISVIDANQLKEKLKYEEKRADRVAHDYEKMNYCNYCKGKTLTQLHWVWLYRALQESLQLRKGAYNKWIKEKRLRYGNTIGAKLYSFINLKIL